MASRLPQTFGRYVLTELIGEGGMAEVYLADVRVAQGLTKRMVIKKIRKDFADQHEFTRMFVEEAKIALSLNHANIVQVFDFGQVRGTFYLAMELVDGTDLMKMFHAVRAHGQRFAPVIAGYLGHQVAAGLAYAHRKRDDYGTLLGIVHRDVSPHNIMVSYEGQVKILDFGIARTKARALERLEAPLASAGTTGGDEIGAETIKGKVAYMSPEQALGKTVDARSDLYSLGVVLYELLSGQLLFRQKDRLAALESVRTHVLSSLLEVAPDVPPELARIVDQALSRDPERRYDSARSMQSDLATYLHRADPVVDDEVLSRFVTRYCGKLARSPGRTTTHESGTTHADTQRSQFPNAASRETQKVVVVHAALEPRRALPGEPAADSSAFLRIAADIAFKREAHTLRIEDNAVVLAFGALLNTGDDAERALRVALALREEISEAAPGLGLGVALAFVMATIRHPPGNAAAVDVPKAVLEQVERVACHSIDGPVLIAGELVERLARAWRFGDATFVGLQTSQEASASVSAELEYASPLLGPLSEAEQRVHHAPGRRAVIYGRELELKTLRDTFSEAIRARETRTLMILGDRGLGKRALLDRFVGALPRSACAVLRGVGQWSRRNVPLGVFVEMLQRFLHVKQDSDPAQVITKLEQYGVVEADKLGEALASAMGLPGAAELELDPLERRDRIWRLVRRLIRALATRRPVLVVIENLHFVDEQSLSVLREWIQERSPLPILGVTTARPGPRAEEFRAHANLGVIELRELDEQARRELIVRRFEDADQANELADAVLARTGGNPLFIEETLAFLLNQGVIGWNAQGRYLIVRQRGAKVELPPSIEEVLQTRIDALSLRDREILYSAAVLGRSFVPSELAQLQGDVAKTLENLIDHGMLERETAPAPGSEMLRFVTMSLHDVCKDVMSSTAGEQLHARAADIKRRRVDYTLGRDDGPIADHLIQAGRPDEAIMPAIAAGAYAKDVAGSVESFYYYNLALRAMAPDDPRRFEVLLERESILRVWGRRRAQGADIRALIRFAEDRSDSEGEVVASTRLLRFYLEVGRTQRAERLIPRLSRRIHELRHPEPHLAPFAELESNLLFTRGHFQAAERTAVDALRYCSIDTSGVRQRCRLMMCVGRVQLTEGHHRRASETFTQTLELARGIGNRRLEAEALNDLGEVAGRSARYQEAVDHFQAALQIDRDSGDRFATGTKLANLGITYAAIGLHRRAERYLRKALELHEAIVQPTLLTDAIVHMGMVVAELGDLAAARTFLQQAIREAVARNDVRTELRARARLASALVHHGSPTDHEEARSMAEEVLAMAKAHGFRTSATRVLHVLALLDARDGHKDRAIMRERDALTLVRAGAAPLDGVLSIYHLGRLLVTEHHESEGRELLEEARNMLRSRLAELRDPELRAGYLEQPTAQEILDASAP